MRSSYRDWAIVCSVARLPDGRFAASIVVEMEDEDVPSYRFPMLPSFPTEEEACDHAHHWAREWIDANF
jgi:hypothetical protein